MHSRRSHTTRPATIGLAVALLLTVFAPSASAATPITLDLQASGLTALTAVTSARDGTDRLFLVERRGSIRVFDDGALRAGFFLDMRTMVESGGERGLLGLAFHPQFTSNGLLYVFYTRRGGDIVIAQWRANAARTAVMMSSFRALLVIEHSSASNHNGGALAFGPDRNLYIAVGDGGGGGDPENDAQNITRNLLGKILRINVNGTGAGPYDRYSIPSSNPFAGSRNGLDEIWAYGLRNPWRISFDRVTGNLFIGDVGQRSWEEIDRQPATSGGGRNYGWRVMEGMHCYNATSCSLAGDTLPVAEYSHSAGKCSITGGYVYRGPTQARIYGHYVYADFCAGRIWTMPNHGGNRDQVLRADTAEQITSFGESDSGELYAVTIDGKLFRVLAP